MNHKIPKTILTVFLGTLFLLAPALAQSYVEFSNTPGLYAEFESIPLFNEGNFIPSRSITKWIKVRNESGVEQNMRMETIHIVNEEGLGNKLNITIKEGANELYSNTLSDFFSVGDIPLSTILNNTETQYNITIRFQKTADNTYQEKTLGFDILIGPGEEGNIGGIPMPGGGGGVVLPPGLSIYNESSAEVQDTFVTITWNTSYDSTSQVIYSLEGGNRTINLSAPNYGYDFSAPNPEDMAKVTNHNVTIGGLAPGTTYYYRCVSHASPATISREHSFVTLSEKEKTGKENFESNPNNSISDESKKGTKESIKIIPSSEGKTLATTTNNETNKKDLTGNLSNVVKNTIKEGKTENNFGANLIDFIKNIPWWVLLIIALILLIISFILKKKKKDR